MTVKIFFSFPSMRPVEGYFLLHCLFVLQCSESDAFRASSEVCQICCGSQTGDLVAHSFVQANHQGGFESVQRRGRRRQRRKLCRQPLRR